MYHVPSHMDDFVKDPDDLLEEWIWNIMADESAEEAYETEQSIDNVNMAKYFHGFMYHKDTPIVQTFGKWARDAAALKLSKQYFSSHHEIALKGVRVDWNCMKSVTKHNKHMWQKIKTMRMMWSLYAYQNIKLSRGHCNPSDTKCKFCGKHTETQEHVLTECQHEELQTIREQLFKQIGETFSEHIKDERLSEWIEKNIQHIWNGDIEVDKITDLKAKDTVADIDVTHFKQCAWAGVISSTQVTMVKRFLAGPGADADQLRKQSKKANRIMGLINGHFSQAVHDVWELRKEKLQVPAQCKNKKQTIMEIATSLAATGMLPGPGGSGQMSITEFAELHSARQRNKITNIVKQVMGKAFTCVEDFQTINIGDIIRTYKLNKATSTCELQQGKIIGTEPELEKSYIVEFEDENTFVEALSYTQVVSRIENPNQLTPQEVLAHDQYVLKCFLPDKPTKLQQAKTALLPVVRQQKIKLEQRKSRVRQTFEGGILEVFREDNTTFVELIYKDGDGETLPFQELLEQVAFKEDPAVKDRIGVIEQMCEKREDRLTYGTIVRQQRARQRGNSNSEEQNLNESSIAASEKQSERVQLNKWAFNSLWIFPPRTEVLSLLADASPRGGGTVAGRPTGDVCGVG